MVSAPAAAVWLICGTRRTLHSLVSLLVVCWVAVDSLSSLDDSYYINADSNTNGINIENKQERYDGDFLCHCRSAACHRVTLALRFLCFVLVRNRSSNTIGEKETRKTKIINNAGSEKSDVTVKLCVQFNRHDDVTVFRPSVPTAR